MTDQTAQFRNFTRRKDTLDLRNSQGQTDIANATRFLDQYHLELLRVPPWKKWLQWDGQRWCNDNGVGVNQRAQRYAKSLWDGFTEVAKSDCDRDVLSKARTFVRSTSGDKRIAAFLNLASYDERVVCHVDELNADPTLLNVANGTIDLTTGKLRPHNPADRITQLAPVIYDPNATCTCWLKSLELYFDRDPETIRYVQQLLGYSISGDTGEHILPIAYGKGNNGKSTIWNANAELLGDYATLANDTLLLGMKGNHPTEKASLYQMRFVAISEPEKESQLKESRVKELTGDNLITARRMNEDFWTFQRTHTFWLSTNHLPRIEGVDDGIWRRVKLIPFGVDIKDRVKPIPDFDKWLVQHEGPGILAWLVQGYLDYRENGFSEPASVTTATRDYKDDSDPFGDFIDEYFIVKPDAICTANDAYRIYAESKSGNMTKTAFGRAMAERFPKSRPDQGAYRKRTIYEGLTTRYLQADDSP